MPRISVSTRANQRRVGVDLVPVPRQSGAGDISRSIAIKASLVWAPVREMEHIADPRQRLASASSSAVRWCFVKARRRRIGRNGGDLGLVVGERAGIGLPEMLGLDAVERGRRVGGGPIRKQRITGRVEGVAGVARLVIGYCTYSCRLGGHDASVCHRQR